MKLSDLRGLRFGRWTVIQRTTPGSGGGTRWECICECGNTGFVYAKFLKNGKSASCGCLRAEISRRRATTHGQSGIEEYGVWSRMIGRCFNMQSEDWPDYGQRGITVCDRWRSWLNFWNDMGKRPSANHSIGRKDNDGPYAPWNCWWENPKQQANNKRNNRRITHAGRTQTLQQWADETGINADSIYARLDVLHWTIERAITTPIR